MHESGALWLCACARLGLGSRLCEVCGVVCVVSMVDFYSLTIRINKIIHLEIEAFLYIPYIYHIYTVCDAVTGKQSVIGWPDKPFVPFILLWSLK